MINSGLGLPKVGSIRVTNASVSALSAICIFICNVLQEPLSVIGFSTFWML